MKTKINEIISYANENKLLAVRDNEYMYNTLAYLLCKDVDANYTYIKSKRHIDDILEDIANEYRDFSTQIEKELFKSKIIGTIIERPSNIEAKFNSLYEIDPTHATNYFYDFSKKVNYIKEREIAKNIEYKVDSKYGLIDITINLSKPEKSPKEIELLKKASSSSWPKCFLCKEQEGLYGSLKNPDRSNHRMINLSINDQNWFFQYSPYSYFNEHAIVLSSEHKNMVINRNTFSNLIEFTTRFPHYMIGSNADIPIVGGSMLTHDHYQTGNYEFPLFKAQTQIQKILNDVEIHSVNWPLDTIKLVTSDKTKLLDVCTHVLDLWLDYEDPANNIFKFTTERHNTITPIVRLIGGNYEMFLILRNNYTTPACQLGVYHVAESRHHIKKENIGLIEAIGLAVLPARLKEELEQLANSQTLPQELVKHQSLFTQMENDKPTNRLQYLYDLVGQIFVLGLEDCSVFKFDDTKYEQFIRNI